jgi:prophage regulatory protein
LSGLTRSQEGTTLTHLPAAARATAPEDLLSPAWREAPDLLGTSDLERLTGTKASTWRYWNFMDKHADDDTPRLCPPSFKLGRRTVWKKAVVLQWLAEQEQAAGGGVAV